MLDGVAEGVGVVVSPCVVEAPPLPCPPAPCPSHGSPVEGAAGCVWEGVVCVWIGVVVAAVPLVEAAIAHPPAPRHAAAVSVAIVRLEVSSICIHLSFGVMPIRLIGVAGNDIWRTLESAEHHAEQELVLWGGCGVAATWEISFNRQ